MILDNIAWFHREGLSFKCLDAFIKCLRLDVALFRLWAEVMMLWSAFLLFADLNSFPVD